MGRDFRGHVWKQVWKMTLYGLQEGQDLENQAAPGVPLEYPPNPTPPPVPHIVLSCPK